MMKRLLCCLLLLCLCFPSAVAEETLRVSCLSAVPEAIARFTESHPEILLQDCDTYFNSQEQFISFLLTQDSSIDIYAITVNMGLDALKSKRYLPVLHSAVIEQEVATWYAPIQACISTADGIIALPYELTTNEWGLNEALWHQLYPDASLVTWQDYLRLILAWQQDETLSETYSLSYAGLTRENVTRSLLFSYISYYETEEAPLNFDTSPFRECLTLLQQITPDSNEPEDEEAWNDRLSMPTLLNETPDPIGSPLYNSGEFVAIPEPRFDAAAAPILRGNMQMYVINPYSQHQDAALLFLGTVAQALPDNQRIRLSPQVPVPIENPLWIKQHAQFAEELQQLTQLETRTDAQQTRLEMLQTWMKDESDRYLVTYAQSERYKQLAACLAFNDRSCFLGFQNGKNVEALLQHILRYFAGNLSQEDCIQTLNRIASQLFYE